MMRDVECKAENPQLRSSATPLVAGFCQCTFRATVLGGLVLGIFLEIVTCLFRFGLHLQSTRDTRAMAVWTFGFRIHHAYAGLLLLLLGLLVPTAGWRMLLLVLGLGLVMSDLAHHFAVLWPLTGDPQFHIRYADLPAPN